MSRTKPLTRTEWDQIRQRADEKYCATCSMASRIEATIEAGGFAPEPVSEEAVIAWLRGRRPLRDEPPTAMPEDLDRARDAACREVGSGGAVHFTREGWSTHILGTRREHKTVEHVARTLAAFAYGMAHGVDVDHLLGDPT